MGNFLAFKNNLCATTTVLFQPYGRDRPAFLSAGRRHEAYDPRRLFLKFMLQRLAPDRFQQRAVEFIIAASRTYPFPQVHFVVLSQAKIERPIRFPFRTSNGALRWARSKRVVACLNWTGAGPNRQSHGTWIVLRITCAYTDFFPRVDCIFSR